jgi:hypothetical protein
VEVLRTTNCRRHGHPEFRIHIDPSQAPVKQDWHWFIGWLEQAVAQGERFLPGQTCQVGWGLLQVRDADEDSLALWEPDMQAMPIEWVDSVSTTLAHLRLQKDVVESLFSADDLLFPSMSQSAIVCTRLGESQGMIMDRNPPKGTDSGWFCGCHEEDHDHNNASELKCVSLYEAAARHSPAIVPYLALPAGVLLAVTDATPTFFQDGEPLEFKPGSYLAARYG